MSTDILTKEYTIERLTANNLADVEKLHTAVYDKVPPKGFFLKKYDTAFTSVKYIGFVAYNVNRVPIGYYGVIPCFIQAEGKIILSAQSGDTMTHPRHRFKGLFVELSNLAFQLCRDNGIRLLFGFPNQNSLPGAINKLGWQATGQMNCFIIPTGSFAWERVFNKLSVLKSLFANYQHKQLKKYLLPKQGMANSVINDGFGGVYRDEPYRQYKTYTQTQVIKIGHATLWVKIGRVFLIGDILVKPADFDDTMHRLKKVVHRLGISEIHFHSSTGTALYNLFAKRFKTVPSFPVLFQDFGNGVPIDQIKFTAADIDTF